MFQSLKNAGEHFQISKSVLQKKKSPERQHTGLTIVNDQVMKSMEAQTSKSFENEQQMTPWEENYKVQTIENVNT